MNRHATASDFFFLAAMSTGVREPVLRKQISDGRIRIVESNGQPIGFLKFYVLWENLPFLEVIRLQESFRFQRFGTEAVREWEREMRTAGHNIALISTVVTETAQHFWRKIGYEDCGALNFGDRPTELFLVRKLS